MDRLKVTLIKRQRTFQKSNQDDELLTPVKYIRQSIACKKYMCGSEAVAQVTSKGNADKSWWPGVARHKTVVFMASLDLPSQLKTIRYSQLLEVSFSIQVTLKDTKG